jgi:hypothetical protein
MAVTDALQNYAKTHSTVTGPDGIYLRYELDKVSKVIALLIQAAKALDTSAHVTTVSALPVASASNKGVRYMVTDANATTFWTIVAAGGTNVVPVTSDGTNWRIG